MEHFLRAATPAAAMRWATSVLFLGFVVACGDDGTVPDTPDGAVASDSDGDTILDGDEGSATNLDTDGDGTPDYLDVDSDNDGIFDSAEAGDLRLETIPLDSDNDGTPDFQDTDADGNGVPDREDGTGDLDGDNVPDFRDRDDDGDFVLDSIEIGDPRAPRDSDGDRAPDHRDTDSDGDYIGDNAEGNLDTDKDGNADRIDTDSDQDGFSDEEEAGDRDYLTPPVDTDGDLIPDFRDPDSDDDGLADSQEAILGTSRTNPDTDGDGVSDLIEAGAQTDATDRNDNPQARGDFVFVVPFEEAPSPLRDTLTFETSLQRVDLYFAFDTTQSMVQEMNAMRDPLFGVPAIIDELGCQVTSRSCAASSDCDPGQVCNGAGRCAEDPLVDSCIPDIWTGVGTFTELDTYKNDLSLQADPSATTAAIPGTGLGIHEAVLQVPACISDGRNCLTGGGSNCLEEPTRLGCPGFRSDAVRILIQITDANEQCVRPDATPEQIARCGMFDAPFVGRALRSRGIRYIGLVGTDDNSGTGSARSLAEAIGRESITLDASGDPLVFDAIDGAVVQKASDAVRTFVDNEFEIRIFAENTEGNAVQFIDYLEVKQATDNPQCPAFRQDGTTPIVAEDTDPDTLEPSGRPDTRKDFFPVLDPGVPVCWDVVPLQNNSVEPTREPQVFLARLVVRAAGSVVDSRDVYFLVPPVIPDPGEPI